MAVVYAVAKGRKTGIFGTWQACQSSVSGYTGAKFKKFSSDREAIAWLNSKGIYLTETSTPTYLKDRLESVIKGSSNTPPVNAETDSSKESSKPAGGTHASPFKVAYSTSSAFNLSEKSAIAYVDGSFIQDDADSYYGYGLFFVTQHYVFQVCGCNNDIAYISSRNVTGELWGALEAVNLAKTLGVEDLLIRHDYNGVSAFTDGSWSPTTPLTQGYAMMMQTLGRGINCHFESIKSHSGEKYNDLVDSLARKAITNRFVSNLGDYTSNIKLSSL